MENVNKQRVSCVKAGDFPGKNLYTGPVDGVAWGPFLESPDN